MNAILPIPLIAGASLVHEVQFMGALGAALAAPNLRVNRADAAFGEYADDANAAAAAMFADPSAALDRYRFAYFADRCDSIAREFAGSPGGRAAMRGDAADYDPGTGVHLARDLEYRTRRVLEEKFALPDVFDLFPMYDDVPPVGAEVFTMRRVSGAGEAKLWNGSDTDVPQVTITQSEEKATVRHIVTGWSVHLFERNANGFAGFNSYDAKVRQGRRVIMAYANRLLGRGSTSAKLYGVTSLPWLDKMLLPVPFTAAQASTPAGCAAVADQIVNLISHPSRKSGGTFRATDVLSTERLYQFLGTKVGDGSGDTIRTLVESKLATPVRWRVAAFLDRAGPGGTDGILATRADQEGISLVIPAPYNVIPNRTGGVTDEFFAFMSIAGCVAPEVGNNVLGWGSFV